MAPKHTKCLLCDGPDLEELEGYERCHLVRCRACDFVFVGRIPTEQELMECYSAKYVENEKGYEWLSPVTSKRLFEWLDFMEPFRKTNRIIDVGCGAGHFLTHALKRGWEAHGTEYPENAVVRNEKKGIKMKQGALDPANYEPESFDVVTSFGVIEHVSDPKKDLANMVKLLRPGGLLFVTTPNFDSLSRYILRSKWNVIMYPEHLSYFTARTLCDVSKRLGLEPRKIETHGFSVSRVRASLKGTDVPFVAPELADEKIRTKLEGNAPLLMVKNGINKMLTVSRKGDELKIQFVKPS